MYFEEGDYIPDTNFIFVNLSATFFIQRKFGKKSDGIQHQFVIFREALNRLS